VTEIKDGPMASKRDWDISAWGIIALLVGAMMLCNVFSEYPQHTLVATYLAIFGVYSHVAIRVYTFMMAILSLVSAKGIFKVRAYGWWLSILILVIDAIPRSIVGLWVMPFASAISLAYMPVYVLWFMFRVPAYHPFRGRWERKSHARRYHIRMALLGKATAAASLTGWLWGIVAWQYFSHGTSISRTIYIAATVVSVWVVSGLAGLIYWDIGRRKVHSQS